MATLIYSVPKSLAVQYLKPETHVRLHSCGFFFLFLRAFPKRFLGAMKPSPKGRVIMAISDMPGGLRTPILGGKEKQSFGKAPDENVQTEPHCRGRSSFTVIRGRCCPSCSAGRAKEALLLPLFPGG